MGCGGRMCYCCSCGGFDATSSPRVEVVHHPSNGERMLNGDANGNGEVSRKDEGGNAKIVRLKSNLKRPSRFSEENGVGERYNTTPTSTSTPTPIDGFRVTTNSVNGTGDVANSVDAIRVEANTTKQMDGIKERVDAIEELSVEAKQEDFHANGRRKVQWTDAHGQELAQVKEFEPSYVLSLEKVHRTASFSEEDGNKTVSISKRIIGMSQGLQIQRSYFRF